MWTIKQIFDGDYGCEELAPGQKPKVSVTLVNENGEEKRVSVEDEWLPDRDWRLVLHGKNILYRHLCIEIRFMMRRQTR